MMLRIMRTKAIAVLLALFLSKTTVDALSTASPAVSNNNNSNNNNKPDNVNAIDNDDNSKLIQVERAMIEFHDAEIANGKDTFATKKLTIRNTGQDASSLVSWGDDAFIEHRFGENDAGMDANYLPKNGNKVFESVSPVLIEEECSFIVKEARETIAKGLMEERSGGKPQDFLSNSQLGEARLSNMPKTRDWLKETLPTRFYPLLKDRFGVDDLVLYDGLVLANLGQTRSQPIHRDASLVTLNVALSPVTDYEGGGTYIEALDEVLRIDQGHLLSHAGSVMHAGNAISEGERWVFVLFLLGESQPQLARRCHAKAIEHMRLQEFDQAERFLQTGLKSIVPNHDHLLHSTLGRLQLAKGEDPSKALQSFRLADEAYPICQEALVSIAQLFIDQRRPRAALRRLDRVLDSIQTRDLDPSAQLSLRSLAYGARRDAARCALICADHLYRQTHDEIGKPSSSSSLLSSSSTWASWILQHLPSAIHRLKTCLAAAPNEPTLLGMLERAEFLHSKAQNNQRRG